MIRIEKNGYKGIRERIDLSLDDLYKRIKKNPDILEDDAFSIWKPKPDMTLIERTYDILMRSWLLGLSHGKGSKPADFADISMGFDLPYEDAIRIAKGRITLTPAQYRKLSAHLKMQAFTVGRLAQLDMVEKAKKAYVKAIGNDNPDMNGFIQDMKKINGDKAGLAGYYELVFRTNIQSDYNAAKAYAMQEDPPLFLQFVAIEDERTSEICEARAGLILPYTDPFWDTNWPPLHYNCRSTIREIFRDEAEKKGLLDKSYNATNTIKGFDGTKKPQGSFGINPAKDNAFWTSTPSQHDRIVRMLIQEELNGVAGETICKDFKKPKKGFSYEPTKKGGIRYDDRLKKESELTGNLEIAKTLAEQEGYYVELRQRELLEHNRQFDAWLNGIDKAEFKDLSTNKLNTLRKELILASEQAGNIIIRIKYNGQIKPLSDVISKNGEFLANTRSVKQIKLINGNIIVTLSNSDLRTPEKIKKKMAWLYRDKD